MAFYVTAITFLVAYFMEKLTNIVSQIYFWFIQMPIIEVKFGIICILTDLWWNIVIDGWNLVEKLLSKWHYQQHSISMMSKLYLVGMTNIVKLTFSVGDSTPRLSINIEQDN